MEAAKVIDGQKYGELTVAQALTVRPPGELHKIFEGLYGCKMAKEVLGQTLVAHLEATDPEVIPENVLLFGIEGCGKTSLLQAASALTRSPQGKRVTVDSSKAEVNCYPMSRSNKEMSIESLKNIIDMASACRPSGILIDDVHILSYKDENGKIGNFLTAVMDMARKAGVLIVAATSYPELLDDKLLQWFKKRVYLPLPNGQDRELILRKAIRDFNGSAMELEGFGLKEIASETAGFTPADLVKLVKACSPVIYKKGFSGNVPFWMKLIRGNPNDVLLKRFKKVLRQWTPSHEVEVSRHKRFAIKYATHEVEEEYNDDISFLEKDIGCCGIN